MYLDFKQISIFHITLLLDKHKHTPINFISITDKSYMFIRIGYDETNGTYKLYNAIYKDNQYYNIGIGEIKIDHNNKLLLTNYLTENKKVSIVYYKGENDNQYIKTIKINNEENIQTTYIATVHDQNNIQISTQFEIDYLNKVTNYENISHYIKGSKLELKVDEQQNTVDFKKEPNYNYTIEQFLRYMIINSNGEDFGRRNQETYLSLFTNCENIKNIKFIDWRNDKNFQNIYNLNGDIISTYFTRLGGGEVFNEEEIVKQFFRDLNLINQNNEIIKLDDNKNFVLIPFACDQHITTLLIDLREDIPLFSKRIYSFDSSGYHYDNLVNINQKIIDIAREDIFGNLKRCIKILSNNFLQNTGCCSFWTEEFCTTCHKYNNITDIIDNFNEIELKIAKKVSERIDITRNLNKAIISQEDFDNLNQNKKLLYCGYKYSNSNHKIVFEYALKCDISDCVDLKKTKSLLSCYQKKINIFINLNQIAEANRFINSKLIDIVPLSDITTPSDVIIK